MEYYKELLVKVNTNNRYAVVRAIGRTGSSTSMLNHKKGIDPEGNEYHMYKWGFDPALGKQAVIDLTSAIIEAEASTWQFKSLRASQLETGSSDKNSEIPQS